MAMARSELESVRSLSETQLNKNQFTRRWAWVKLGQKERIRILPKGWSPGQTLARSFGVDVYLPGEPQQNISSAASSQGK